MRCHIDIESFSEADLQKVGVYKYAEHPSTEILCICYAFGNGPVNLWVPDENLPDNLLTQIVVTLTDSDDGALFTTHECPSDLKQYVEKGGQLAAHNAEFERTMLNGVPGQNIGFPRTKIKQWVCTAAKAAAHGLPRALKDACNVLDAVNKKDESGKSNMMSLCRPRRKDDAPRWTPQADPERFFKLYIYCVDDVKAERCIDHMIPDLIPYEQKIWQLDQIVNRRGIKIDQELLVRTREMRDKYKVVLEERGIELTGFRPTQTGKLSMWINERYPIDNLQAPTIKDALFDPAIPDSVKQALKIRTAHAMKAPSKLEAMERAVCSDSRLHGMFLYHGGSPGRWASRLVQLQNMFRSIIKNDNLAIETILTGDYEWFKTVYGDYDLMKVFASIMRGIIVPSEGKDFVCGDYSSIEARVLAWMANSKTLLNIYNTHGMVYEHTAAQVYNLKDDLESLKKITKEQRFVGKIASLALGFQGGYRAFISMAKRFGVEMSEELAEQIKCQWRDANPEVVQMWYALERAWMNAVTYRGEKFTTNRITFQVKDDFMYMFMPSGRPVVYYKPAYVDNQCEYWGVDTFTRQYCNTTTYGGSLVQSSTEAIARDVLCHGMLNLERDGRWPILGFVHDELITEPNENEGPMDEMLALMCDKPEWAAGLPVAADGFRAKRYRK